MRSHRGLRCAIGLSGTAALLVVLCSAAAAQPRDDDRARVHFEAGRSYFEEGNYENALEEWRRSYELSGRPELLLNVATTLERLARWGEAADALERYLAEQEEVANRSVLERRVANLRARATEQSRHETAPEPTTPAPPPDRAPPPPAPAPVEGSPAPAPAPVGTDGGGGLPTASLVSYIVAGVGLATFAVFGALALSEESEVADGCGRTRTCGDDELDPIDTKALVADFGLAVAVVGGAVGTVMWLLDDGGAAETRAAVTPWVAPGSAGASAAVRF